VRSSGKEVNKRNKNNVRGTFFHGSRSCSATETLRSIAAISKFCCNEVRLVMK
jgi:hypothetical protein